MNEAADSHLCKVILLVIDYLRELYIADLKDDHQLKWPNDLRYQSYLKFSPRESEATFPNAYLREWNVDRSIFTIIKTLNSLNRHAHTHARRLLGRKLVFNVPSTSSDSFRSFMHSFDLLDSYTHTLVYKDEAKNIFDDNEPIEPYAMGCRLTFLHTFSTRVDSLRNLHVAFVKPEVVKNALKTMIDRSPNLEELCLEYRGWSSSGSWDLVDRLFRYEDNHDPDEWKPTCRSTLRVIRLRYFALRHPLRDNLGLPRELLRLLVFDSIMAVDIYRPYHYLDSRVESDNFKFGKCFQKIAWAREAGQEFTSKSAWLRDVDISEGMSDQESKLLMNASSLTLEIAYSSAAGVVPILARVWSSMRSLTIITDDFPTPDFLRHIPNALEHLIIAFKAHCCRTEPRFLDRRLCRFLESHAIKYARICIGAFIEKRENEIWLSQGRRPSPFAMPDSSLFVKSREFCSHTGCQFILENMKSVPWEKIEVLE